MGENKKISYPSGVHTVRFRVQNSIGVWSNWVSKTFEVVSAKTTIRTVEDLENISLDGDYVLGNDINLVGQNWKPIGQVFFGSLDGNGYKISNFAGGLVGRSTHSTITNTFSVGRIVGRVHTGGLVGQSIGTDIINSYYNKNSSGQSDSNKGEPKTTEELKEKSTYQDWDFQNTWNINEGDYPFLR